MRIIKKLCLSLLVIGGLWLMVFGLPMRSPIKAQTKPVIIYFFHSKTCPHCVKEEVFLDQLIQKYPGVEVQSFEISQQKNIKLLQQVIQKYKASIPAGVVPFTAIGENYIVGFLDEQTTGKQIEEALLCAINTGCQDVVGGLLEPQTSDSSKRQISIPPTLTLPLLGEIKTKNFSLPLLAIVIGLLDGFNPCAMWALLFLISLLLGMKDRKRMWILGTAFIVVSGLVYFLFMAAWLNFFLFLGLVIWVRIIIGLVALTAGGYSLREYWLNKEAACKITGNEKRRTIFAKLKNITQQKHFWLALGGIIVLAFAVNLVELVCSAGLPAIFTQVLALNHLPTWQYYLYLLLYILFFMLDDLVVFGVAMITLKAVGIETKYARYSRLIGGSLMIIIGILMLFKPEWLMFG
ncbi:hypothetical protein KKD62_01600 [Patescibacteria group bacterium]|nr:hypothetical protein [Patescibacteria group bacterium]MBU1931416.1 hypothetical protein [Patescibacteria group bacterium]